jgi:hypothetical protein
MQWLGRWHRWSLPQAGGISARWLPDQVTPSPVPAALSSAPGVLLEQLPGSADLQPVIRRWIMHLHPEHRAVYRFNQTAMLRASWARHS